MEAITTHLVQEETAVGCKRSSGAKIASVILTLVVASVIGVIVYFFCDKKRFWSSNLSWASLNGR
jgi:hypothetical protein